MFYDYMKAIHILAVIAWMAGMFYLPRLFVYHAEVGAGTPQAETFKVMEARLLRVIMNPAMVVSLALGIWLGFFSDHDWSRQPWLHAKIALVVGLLALHGLLAKWRKDFARDIIPHSGRFFRIVNEIPTVLLIGIVLLATVKPAFM